MVAVATLLRPSGPAEGGAATASNLLRAGCLVAPSDRASSMISEAAPCAAAEVSKAITWELRKMTMSLTASPADHEYGCDHWRTTPVAAISIGPASSASRSSPKSSPVE